jgi:hypothetical protein
MREACPLLREIGSTKTADAAVPRREGRVRNPQHVEGRKMRKNGRMRPVRNRAPIRAVALTLLALLCGCAHDGDPLRYRLATSGTGIGTMSGVSGKSENYELCHPGADRGNRAPNRVTQLVVRTGPCGRVATETAKGGGADLTGWCLQSARRDGAASTSPDPSLKSRDSG